MGDGTEKVELIRIAFWAPIETVNALEEMKRELTMISWSKMIRMLIDEGMLRMVSDYSIRGNITQKKGDEVKGNGNNSNCAGDS